MVSQNLWSMATASAAGQWFASGTHASDCSTSSIKNLSIPHGQVLDLSATPVNDYNYKIQP